MTASDNSPDVTGQPQQDASSRLPLTTHSNTDIDEQIRQIIGDEDWKYTEQPHRIEQLISSKIVSELETLRKSMRGEDPNQYRPKDMISMGMVEEIIDEQIAELKGGHEHE